MAHLRMNFDHEPDVDQLGVAIFEHCSNEPQGSQVEVELVIEGITTKSEICCGNVTLEACKELAKEKLIRFSQQKENAVPRTSVPTVPDVEHLHE